MKIRRKDSAPAAGDTLVRDNEPESAAASATGSAAASGAEEEALAAVGPGPADGMPALAVENGAAATANGAAPAAAAAAETATAATTRPRPKGLLGQVLVKRGLVTEEQITAALGLQSGSGKRLGEVLVEMGALEERDLVDALADFFGLEVTHLRREAPEPAALALVPEAVARENLVIPVHVDGDVLHVAVAQPSDDLRLLLTEASAHSVRLRLAPLSDIRWAIDRSYQAIGSVGKMVQAFEAVETTRKRAPKAAEQPASVAENAPVVQVVDSILTQAIRDRASDVHIEPSQGAVHIRFRIDGTLKDVLELPVAMGTGLVSRIKIMAGIDIVEKRRSQDGQFTSTVDGKDTDVRVATVATIWGESCVLRILDKNRSVLRLGELGMPADTHQTFSKMVHAPFGMVLCAGPTGSGKTTTLYATLSEVSERSRKVMTIEDPVEFVFPMISQIQTNEAAGLTFASGLRSILRQDPDVILVGEIRDVETARIAVQSALTGHFVLSSVHGTDSVSALHRFLDMGIESFLISSSVIAVVGQRLVRRICPSCKTRYTPSTEELTFYEENGGEAKSEFWHGTGCNFCGDTGYLDRIGVYELLRMTPEIKRLIVGWATQDELRRQAEKQGMRTLRDEAINLVVHDTTTISEVMRSIYSA
jgi:type IV pilus assembly protein PilB